VRRHVEAAGGVLWRRVDGQVQVAVVHRPRYDDWSLPKGKLERHELGVLGAAREVREETGFDAVVGRTLGESRYRVLDGSRDVPKTVRWWAMRATSGEFAPGPEVDTMLWLDVPAALARVSAGRDSGPLTAFEGCPPETATVLLVRHGRAGRKQDWDGPDELRPLDERGRAQSRAVAEVLPAYGPGRVLSAPALRCRQTVQLLADRLGTELGIDTDLAEQSREALPGRLRALASLSADGAVTVACSQGGAIPHALDTLTAGTPLANSAMTARKGSLWALSFSGERLVDADYTPDLTA